MTKLLTALYVLLLAGIVYLADHHRYHGLFSAVRSVPGGDKLGHLILMGLFSFLLNTSLRCRTVGAYAGRVLLGSVIVCVAVTLEEVSQLFLRYRSFDPLDLFFDYVGIWAFGKAAVYFCKRRSLKQGGVA